MGIDISKNSVMTHSTVIAKINSNRYPVLFLFHRSRKSRLPRQLPPYPPPLSSRKATLSPSRLDLRQKWARIAVAREGCRDIGIFGSWCSGREEGISRQESTWRTAPAWWEWPCWWVCYSARGRDWYWSRWARHCNWCRSWSQDQIFRNCATPCWDPAEDRWLWQHQGQYSSFWGISSRWN